MYRSWGPHIITDRINLGKGHDLLLAFFLGVGGTLAPPLTRWSHRGRDLYTDKARASQTIYPLLFPNPHPLR